MTVTLPHSTTGQERAGTREARLVYRNGEQSGEVILLPRGTWLLGSHPGCKICLPGQGIAEAHALLLRGAERTLVRSLSGESWINDQPLEEAELRLGDRLTFGALEMEFEPEIKPPPAPASPAGVRPGEEASSPTANPPTMAARELAARLELAEDHGRLLERSTRRLRRRERGLRRQVQDLQQRLVAQSAAATAHSQVSDDSYTARLQDIELRLAENSRQQQQLLDERNQWRQAQEQLAELLRRVPAELNELRERQTELAAAQQRPLPAQPAADERLVARCHALEQELVALRGEQGRLEAERTSWQAECRRVQDDNLRQISQLDHRLELLAHSAAPAERNAPAETPREECIAPAQRHSMEDRLAGLRAEREALEGQQRKERAEQALSRHLDKLTHEPPQPRWIEPEAKPAAEPEAIDRAAEASRSPAAPLAEGLDAAVERPSRHSMDAPQSAPPSDEPPPASPGPNAADPFERLTRLLQKEGSPLRAGNREEVPASAAVAAETEAELPQPSMAFEQPSQAAPVSAAELRRMNHNPQVEASPSADESPAHIQPRSANPADEPAVVLGTSSARREEPASYSSSNTSGDEPKAAIEEDSIDDYMARLLQRVRTVTNEAKSDVARKQESSDYSRPARQAAPPPQPAKSAEEEDLERRKQEYVRRAAPESTSDLRSLREVANLQARQAIDTHARKRLTDVRGGKLLVVLLALGMTAVLGWLKWQGYIDSYLGVAGGVIVALLWGLQYLSIVLRTKRKSAPVAPAAPAAPALPKPSADAPPAPRT